MTSCIFVLVKDEQLYLKEFLDYHFNIGINHIFVVEDPKSKSHKDITDQYSKDKVTLMNALDVYETEETYQRALYEIDHFFNMQSRYLKNGLKYLHNHYNYDWCFIIDVDEYITIDKDNINDVLEEYKDYDAVVIQWKIFGANGLIHKPDYSKKGLIETYTKECQYQRKDDMMWYQKVKTVYNMNHYYYDLYSADHLPKLNSNWCRTNFTQDKENIIYDKIYIRHYITKSWEEYVYKIKVRGMFHKNHRDYKSFFEMNPDMIDKKDMLIYSVDDIIKKYI